MTTPTHCARGWAGQCVAECRACAYVCVCALCRAYDGEQAGCEAGDEVFPGTGAHDGVMSSRYSGAVIRRHHQTHLNKLTRVTGQPAMSHTHKKIKHSVFFLLLLRL